MKFLCHAIPAFTMVLGRQAAAFVAPLSSLKITSATRRQGEKLNESPEGGLKLCGFQSTDWQVPATSTLLVWLLIEDYLGGLMSRSNKLTSCSCWWFVFDETIRQDYPQNQFASICSQFQ